MGAIEHLTISLPAELADQMRARIAAGDFRDENDVVVQALQAMELDGPEEDPALDAWLRHEVTAALDELDRDPSRGIPIDEVRARLLAQRIARGE